jgi:hypothetical protein
MPGSRRGRPTAPTCSSASPRPPRSAPYLAGVEHATLVDWANDHPVLRTTDGSPGISVGDDSGGRGPVLGWPVTLLLLIAGLTLIAAIVLITVPVLAAGRDVPSSG